MRRRPKRNKKLRAVRVLSAIRHRENSSTIVFHLEILVLEFSSTNRTTSRSVKSLEVTSLFTVRILNLFRRERRKDVATRTSKKIFHKRERERVSDTYLSHEAWYDSVKNGSLIFFVLTQLCKVAARSRHDVLEQLEHHSLTLTTTETHNEIHSHDDTLLFWISYVLYMCIYMYYICLRTIYVIYVWTDFCYYIRIVCMYSYLIRGPS